jgi:hypothetical protein
MGAGSALASTSTNETSNSTKVESKGLALIVSKRNTNDSTADSEQTFSSDSGSSIKMPALSSVLGGNSSSSSSNQSSQIQTRMLVAESNPFQSSKSSVSGAIVSLDLTDSSGNEISVNNTLEPFVINIPASTLAKALEASVGLTGFTYHKLYFKKKGSLHVVIKPKTIGDHYFIYIKESTTKVATILPDERNFDFAFSSPNNGSYPDDLSDELKYTAYLAAENIKDDHTYYIGVKLASE